MAAFTTIAAGVSAATALAGTTASFVQAGKQRELAKQAQEDADKAFAEAEKELDINYMKELSIAKQPYEIQRERLSQLAAEGMQVGAESDRLAAATAGRVMAQAQKAEQDITSRQIADIQALEQKIAKEERDLATKRASLGLKVAEGAGAAAAQAQQLQQQATQQGIEGIGQTLSAALSEELLPLYGFGNQQQQTDVIDTSSFDINAIDPSSNMFSGSGSGMASVTGVNNLTFPE